MKRIKMKRVLLGAMLAALMLSLASVSLPGCLVCRDCGPNRHFGNR